MAPATVELAPGDQARAAESIELPVASKKPAETLEKFLISSRRLPVVESYVKGVVNGMMISKGFAAAEVRMVFAGMDGAVTGAFNKFVVPGSSKMEGEFVGDVVCDSPLFDELVSLTGNPIKLELLSDVAGGTEGVSEFRLPT